MSLLRSAARRLGLTAEEIADMAQTREEWRAHVRKHGRIGVAKRIAEYLLTPAEEREALLARRREEDPCP